MPDMYPLYLDLAQIQRSPLVCTSRGHTRRTQPTDSPESTGRRACRLQQAPRLQRSVRQPGHEQGAAARARTRFRPRQRARHLHHAGHGRGWGSPPEAWDELLSPATTLPSILCTYLVLCFTPVYFVPLYLPLYLHCIQTWAGNIVSQCIHRCYALYLASRGAR